MAQPRILGFSGNPSRPSRTRLLVETVVSGIAGRIGGEVHIEDLADLGPAFGAARHAAELNGAARLLIEKIIAADVLVVGSPTYKGSYSGLFKHVFDLVDPLALVGKPVILTATGGSDRHALIVEHQLRPLFGFFAAHTAPTGIYATERDFADGRLVAEPVFNRIGQSIAEIERLLPAPASGPVLLAAE